MFDDFNLKQAFKNISNTSAISIEVQIDFKREYKKLKSKHQRVLKDIYLKGKDSKEIGIEEGVGDSAIRNRHKRALDILRKKLQDVESNKVK